MKYTLIMAMSLAILSTETMFTELEAVEHGYYPQTAIVTEMNRAVDLVTVTDANGNDWQFEGCEDYELGDYVSMIMSDNGTETIYDDEIIMSRYSGFTGGEPI